MALTSMLDNVPELKDGMVPIYKDGERTVVPLEKYFYDISVFLGIKRIEHLFSIGHGIKIVKDRNSMKFSIDTAALDKLYALQKDQSGRLFQAGKLITIPKEEVVQSLPKDVTRKASNEKDEEIEKLKERISVLESSVLMLMEKTIK